MRSESFLGVDTNQNFSKIKNRIPFAERTAHNENLETKFDLNNYIETVRARLTGHSSAMRLVRHTALIGAAVAVLAAGRINATPAVAVHDRSQGIGGNSSSADDRASTLATGAILATSTHSVIADQVVDQATTTAAQAQFATASGDFLIKNQPVSTNGVQSHELISYTVKGGDTLSTISEQFNVTTDTIRWANNITDDGSIKPGQSLVILPVSGILYDASGSDDLGVIATKYQSSAALIDSFNGLEGKAPAPGQKLVIPDGVQPAAVAPVTQAIAAKPSTTTGGNNVSTPTVSFRAGGANGYGYGYCTWYVAGRRYVPGGWGNASSWYYNAQASGYRVGSVPVPGAIAWGHGNHVAYVESVGAGTVTVSEMNYYGNGGGWNRVSRRTTSAGEFSYIY